MPAAIDLSAPRFKKPFGRLRVIGPDADAEAEYARSHPGRPKRFVRVACGEPPHKTWTVSLGNLTSGNTTSCGCARREKRAARAKRERAARAKRERAAPKLLSMKGRLPPAVEDAKLGTLYHPRKAADYLRENATGSRREKDHYRFLSLGQRHPMKALGRCIRGRRQYFRGEKPTFYPCKQDLDAILAAWDGSGEPAPAPAPPRTVPLKDLAAELGMREMSLCCLLRRTGRWSRVKKVRHRRYVPDDIARSVRSLHSEEPIPAGWGTAADAARRLGFRRASPVYQFIGPGLPLGEGRTVRRMVGGRGSSTYPKDVTIIPDALVENLWQKRQGECAPIAAPATSPPAPEPPRKKRGRPKGTIDHEASSRNDRMRADWAAKKFATVADLARRYHVSRPLASAVVNGQI